MILTKPECEEAYEDLYNSICELEEIKSGVETTCVFDDSLDRFKELIDQHFDEKGHIIAKVCFDEEKLKEIVKEAVRNLTWIPVEERLPEQSLNSVIGWDAYRERCVFVQYYMDEWILGNHESVKIVAWMPVPEPYKKV